MELRHVSDWTTLVGTSVEIRREGISIAHGHVDIVTKDGSMLWLQAELNSRKLYDKIEGYEAWASDPRLGFHDHINLSEVGTGTHHAPNLHGACL